MGLFSKDPNKGWGGSSDRCVITGAKATGTSKTLFGGRVKVDKAFQQRLSAAEQHKAAAKKSGKR